MPDFNQAVYATKILRAVYLHMGKRTWSESKCFCVLARAKGLFKCPVPGGHMSGNGG